MTLPKTSPQRAPRQQAAQDAPKTARLPEVRKVFIRTKGKPGPRDVAVVQVLDFYPEGTC